MADSPSTGASGVPRQLVNRFGGWMDGGDDAWGCLGRAIVAGVLILMAGLLLFAVILLPVAIYAGQHPAPPSLFCRNGSSLQSQPATVIVAKVPVQGVRFTCQDGIANG